MLIRRQNVPKYGRLVIHNEFCAPKARAFYEVSMIYVLKPSDNLVVEVKPKNNIEFRFYCFMHFKYLL